MAKLNAEQLLAIVNRVLPEMDNEDRVALAEMLCKLGGQKCPGGLVPQP